MSPVSMRLSVFSFKIAAPTETYTLSLHDALPICHPGGGGRPGPRPGRPARPPRPRPTADRPRSEEHTSELQSRGHLVCRLLLEKKKHLPHGVAMLRRRRNLRHDVVREGDDTRAAA